jgi:hypothetical protein
LDLHQSDATTHKERSSKIVVQESWVGGGHTEYVIEILLDFALFLKLESSEEKRHELSVRRFPSSSPIGRLYAAHAAVVELMQHKHQPEEGNFRA